MKQILIAFALITAAVAQTNTPAITAIVTASTFGGYLNTASPGSYIEIYGANLAGTSRVWATGDFRGADAPTTLDGVTVSINGTAAFVNYVSPGQVNAEVPDTIAAGNATVVVSYKGQSSAAATMTINPLQPGLLAPVAFKVNGNQYVAALHARGKKSDASLWG